MNAESLGPIPSVSKNSEASVLPRQEIGNRHQCSFIFFGSSMWTNWLLLQLEIQKRNTLFCRPTSQNKHDQGRMIDHDGGKGNNLSFPGKKVKSDYCSHVILKY